MRSSNSIISHRLRWCLIGVIVSLFVDKSFAQINTFDRSPSFTIDTVSRWHAWLDVKSFFKNNEYLNPIYEGSSYLGLMMDAAVAYQYSGSELVAGARVQMAYGDPLRFKIYPLIRLKYQVTPSFAVTLGTLKGTSEHRIPIILYGVDSYLEHPIEYGISLNWRKKALDLESWIDWRKNIILNDTFQEHFIQGNRLGVNVLDSLGVQMSGVAGILFSHHGGQINRVNEGISTLVNYYFQPSLQYFWTAQKYVGVSIGYYAFVNDDANKLNIESKGKVWSFTASMNLKNFQLDLGYRYLDHFYAPYGDKVYGFFNLNSGEKMNGLRQMIYGKPTLILTSGQTFTLTLSPEFFYDLNRKSFDYNYLLLMSCRLSR